MARLKQGTKLAMSSHASFKKHKEEVDATINLQHPKRLCHWCLSRVCLEKRLKFVEENLQFKKIKKYATFRTEVDKATEFMCHRYVKNMTKKADWKGIDTEVKKDLMAYIKETPFEVIMESTEHRKRVNGMTYMRASDRVCYWCLSEECLHIRRFHTSPGNAELELSLIHI